MVERTIETRAVITAADKTGAAFASVVAKLRNVERAASAASQVASRVASKSMIDGMSNFENRAASVRMIERMSKVRSEVEKTAASAERFARAMKMASETARRVAPIAEGYIGMKAVEATKSSLGAGADLQRERIRLAMAGIPVADQRQADDLSVNLAAKYPNVGRPDVLEAYKDLRSIVLHPSEAASLLPTVIAAKSAMKVLGGKADIGDDGLVYALKAAEVMGRAQDPTRFKGLLDAIVRAQQVLGNTIRPEDTMTFARNLKSSAISLSDRFVNTVGMSLIQDMGPDRAGVGLDQFIKQIVGGFQGNQHAAAKEFIALHMADKSDFELTKTGEIKGMKHGHTVLGADLARTDPDKWIKTILLPHMAAAGITSLNDIASEVRRLFTSSRAADIVSKLIQQMSSFEQHAKNMANAAGIDQGLRYGDEDASVALSSLNTAVESFAGTLTSPVMASAGHMMSGLAKDIGAWGRSLDTWQKQHPDLAKIAGASAVIGGAGIGVAGTYGFLSALGSGFGLKGSAAALDASAAELSAAAATMRAGGALGAVPGGSAAAAAENAGLVSGLFRVGLTRALPSYMLYDLGKTAIDLGLDQLPHPKYPKGYDPKTFDFFGDLIDQFKKLHDAITTPSGKVTGTFAKPIVVKPSPDWFMPEPMSGKKSSKAAKSTSEDFTIDADRSFHKSGMKVPASNLDRQTTVSLDPNSKVDVFVKLQIDDGAVVKALAKATTQASGSTKASVGTTDFAKKK